MDELTLTEPMNRQELRALAEIETYWQRHGKWPKVITTPDFDLEESMEKESFIRGLFNRGITPPKQSELSDEFSDAQLSAILLVVDINDRRTIPAKLKSIGVNSQTWQGWMKDRNFKEYLHNLSSRTFEDALHLAQQGLLSAVQKGDVNAIKYWNELTGRAVSPEIQNARILVNRLAQVIQTYVKDPDLLMEISRGFERVMRGESPDPVVMLPSM